jgi:cellulose biosynthesis protein BcsQ
LAKRIALFNHKGGVSKTTTAFNLGWMLASMGRRVMLVDADPQCNLTGLILGLKTASEFERFYASGQNIKAALEPAFESQPTRIKPVSLQGVSGRSNLFLLPGHIGLAEYDITLGIAQTLSSSLQALRNIPGSINYLLSETAKKHSIDIAIIDMSPSLSALNQNLLLTSDFFIVPMSPDFFSVMAIDSLKIVLPRWSKWAQTASTLDELRMADYPFPATLPKFLGTIVQNYRKRQGQPTSSFRVFFDELSNGVKDDLFPALRRSNLTLPIEAYTAAGLKSDFLLASIPHFNTLIAKSQQFTTPVYALSASQIGHTGPVLKKTMENRNEFKVIFTALGKRVEQLIEG